MDWDLDAPGLPDYFAPLLPAEPVSGLVELVEDFSGKGARPFDHYVTRLRVEAPGAVSLLAAGRRDSSYVDRVQRIDWSKLYAERQFGDFLEELRARWIETYDFVLVDSRTGITDIGAICTAHLPDRLVLVFTANEQSLRGAVDIAERADRARDRMPYDRTQLTVLPLLSRFDSRQEYERAEHWRDLCADATTPLLRNWLDRKVKPETMLRQLTVPYVSYWSFGEQLPVLAETSPSPDQVSYALETSAAVVAHRFARTDLLARSRDSYLAAAQRDSDDAALPAVVTDPAQRPADVRIGMWGAPGSGKTSYLAALNVVVNGRSGAGNWIMSGADDKSADFLAGVTDRLVGQQRFPPATATFSSLQFRFVGREEHGGAFELDVFDAVGAQYGGSTHILDADLDIDIDRLDTCSGLLYLYDPTAAPSSVDWLFRVVRRLAHRGFVRDEMERLPHRLAVCVTKFDDPFVYHLVRSLDLPSQPHVPAAKVHELFNGLPGGAATYSLVTRYFRRDRVRVYLTSAVGFSQEEVTNVYRGDDGRDWIRGPVQPVNVFEPLLWLGEGATAPGSSG